MTDPGAELVEHVDRSGAVIDIVTRRRMREEGLRHRCTYVAVVVGSPFPPGTVARSGLIDAATPVIVHERAAWKDTYPSYWDLAFGGVCAVGEAWDDAAERELAEEAGIVGSTLVDLGPCAYEDEGGAVVGRAYVTAWPDEPVLVDGEAVAVDRVDLRDLAEWIGTVPVCPDTASLVTPLLLGLAGDG